MTELEMTTEAEVEDFTDELSDEALDRAEGYGCVFLCRTVVLTRDATIVRQGQTRQTIAS